MSNRDWGAKIRGRPRRLSGKDGPGAGRPAKLYGASDRQLEISLPGRRYEQAARLLAEAFSQQGTGPAEAVDQVAHRFGEGLGAQARRRLGRRPSNTRLFQTTCQLVCGMNLSLARGLLAGLGPGALEARLEPQPGMCCVAYSMAQHGRRPERRRPRGRRGWLAVVPGRS